MPGSEKSLGAGNRAQTSLLSKARQTYLCGIQIRRKWPKVHKLYKCHVDIEDKIGFIPLFSAICMADPLLQLLVEVGKQGPGSPKLLPMSVCNSEAVKNRAVIITQITGIGAALLAKNAR